jgi:hypothetical protein
MKSLQYILPLLTLSFVLLSINELEDTNSENQVGGSLEARINTYKYELKQLIKPARYEASRVTYYSKSSEKQVRGIEAYLLINTEYKLAFSGKECTSKVGVKVYDKENGTLLKEIKTISAKNTEISSKDLNSVYRKKVTKKERLKSVYIEYSIQEGIGGSEGIVFVIGYID